MIPKQVRNDHKRAPSSATFKEKIMPAGIFKNKFGYLIESVLASILIGIIIPLIFALRAQILGVELEIYYFFSSFIFSFTVSFCIYFFNVQIVKKFQSIDFRSHFVRVVLELSLTIAVSAIVMSIVASLFLGFYLRKIGLKEDIAPSDLFDNILTAVIVNIVAVTIMEIIYFFKKWKKTLIETEQLKRQNIEIKYAVLTSQINPHFLFNSLNALSSLIEADPKKALVFTKEFSKIYRYVLDINERMVVSLGEELNFLNSYLYLQKIRFDKALNHSIQIDASCLEYFLPPLSLQILVENAIKHNEISEENPLFINIKASETEVSVVNNFNPKEKNESKNGLGLKNLKERYSHYTEVSPVFKVENNNYIAIVPLIKDET